MGARFLIYGASGYTARLTARLAKEQGLSPLLVGRSEERVRAVAEPLGFEHAAASLDDPAALDAVLGGVDVALHMAGPFSATYRPMVEACLRTGTHYLDITGEIAVFEALALLDAEARERGNLVLPGAGFDTVPSDCLAAHVASRVPGAQKLVLAISLSGRMSRGTARTTIEGLRAGTPIRAGGRIVTRPARALRRQVDFGEGPRPCVAVGWGDVSTAWHSTGIPDIEVYFEETREVRWATLMSRHAGKLLGTEPMQRLLGSWIDKQPHGPTDAERARGHSLLWAEATHPDGRRAASRMRTPTAYTVTADASLAIVRRVLAGGAPPGFRTPSSAYGADLVMELPGVTREDIA